MKFSEEHHAHFAEHGFQNFHAALIKDYLGNIEGARKAYEETRKKKGMTTSVALGYGWTDIDIAREANDYILESAKTHSGKIVPFCSVNPAWGDQAVAEIERCADLGALGVGELHPDTQGFDPGDTELLSPLMDCSIRTTYFTT